MHLVLAALTWTVVGFALAFVGTRWIVQSEVERQWPYFAGAIVLGLTKGLFILRKTANRNIQRIIDRGDNRCLGGYLSWKTWLFVLGMMALGRLLRGSPMPRELLGAIYAGIGLALASSALPIWKAIGRYKRSELSPPAP